MRAGTTMFVPIVVFDIAGPIIVQSVARSHGASITLALALSGIPPAVWILARMLWRGRVDAVGVFVLSSIILATLIGLATGSGRLYLLDGAILTGVFGLVCPLSLWLHRDRSCSTLRSNRRAASSHRKGGSSPISGAIPRFAACSW